MRNSKWTKIYGDLHVSENEEYFFYYIRLVPSFMDTTDTSFIHGISLNCNQFKTEEEANNVADEIDKFFDSMEQQLIEELKEA